MLQFPTDETSILDAALMYAAVGLAPIRVYGIVDGKCTCGGMCDKPGKHPIGAEWQKRASTDVDRVREVFRHHRGNLGVALGGRFVLLDVDGEEGMTSLAALGELPPTLQQQTGRGLGAHLIYSVTEWQAKAITDRRIAPGLDVKARGQFVAAPSLHISGRRYRVVNSVVPVPLPAWLFERVRKPTPVRLVLGDPAPSATSAVTMRRLRAWMRSGPPAVSGEGGHDRTFQVARKIAAHAELTEGEMWSLLCDFNTRCAPDDTWSEAELRHKLADARKNPGTRLQERRREPRPPREAPHPALSVVEGGADTTAAPAAETPAVARAEQPGDGWRDRLLVRETKRGPELVPCAENVSRVLQLDPRWAGRLWLDTYRQEIVVEEAPWAEEQRPAEHTGVWRDSDDARLHGWLIEHHQLDVSRQAVADGVQLAAERSARSSAREWLEQLVWDGAPRLSAWLTTYLGVEDTPYARLVGRWWVMSAAARVLMPGCKVDTALVLYGPQGAGKSSALRTLAGDQWFCDSGVDMESREGAMVLRGKLVVELAELASLRRATMEAAKRFLAAQDDTYRAPYGRRTVTVPRQCVFAATTNEGEHGRDPTGARRFWTVVCGTIDRPALARDREQLWAEAAAAVEAGEPWWPSSDGEHALVAGAAAEHREIDPWDEPIRRYLDDLPEQRVRVDEVLEHACRVDRSRQSQADAGRVRGVLVSMGWKSKSMWVEGRMIRAWVPNGKRAQPPFA